MSWATGGVMIYVEVTQITVRGVERAAGWLTVYRGQVWVWLDGATTWAVVDRATDHGRARWMTVLSR